VPEFYSGIGNGKLPICGAFLAVSLGNPRPYLAGILPGCKRRFVSLDKGLRSKTKAGKLWHSEAWERAKRLT